MQIRSFDCSKEPLVKGVSLLEASAGTGKTYALARIVLRLIAEQGLEIGKILVVTFTTAATEELRGRIRDLLVDALNLLQDPSAEITDETILQLKKTVSFVFLRHLGSTFSLLTAMDGTFNQIINLQI